MARAEIAEFAELWQRQILETEIAPARQIALEWWILPREVRGPADHLVRRSPPLLLKIVDDVRLHALSLPQHQPLRQRNVFILAVGGVLANLSLWREPAVCHVFLSRTPFEDEPTHSEEGRTGEVDPNQSSPPPKRAPTSRACRSPRKPPRCRGRGRPFACVAFLSPDLMSRLPFSGNGWAKRCS